MKYRVHRFDLKMTHDQGKLEEFLNILDGEVIAVVPTVSLWFYWIPPAILQASVPATTL